MTLHFLIWYNIEDNHLIKDYTKEISFFLNIKRGRVKTFIFDTPSSFFHLHKRWLP